MVKLCRWHKRAFFHLQWGIFSQLFLFSIITGCLGGPRGQNRATHQVGEVVRLLASHQPAGITEASDVLDVGLKPRRVGLEHNVNKRRQEVVGRGGLIFGAPDGAEDVLTAAFDASKLVLRHLLRVHFNDVSGKERKKGLYTIKSQYLAYFKQFWNHLSSLTFFVKTLIMCLLNNLGVVIITTSTLEA